MKRHCTALMLGIVSIIMISCSNGNQAKSATDEFMNTKSFMMEFVNKVAKTRGVEVRIHIEEWDNTPIDTISKRDLYNEPGVKCLEGLVTSYKAYEEDSIQIVEYEQKYETATPYWKEYYYNKLSGLKESAAKNNKNAEIYNERLLKINALKQEDDLSEVMYYVYQFTERMSYKENGENHEEDFMCFSYIDAKTNEVAYVHEGAGKIEQYSRFVYSLPFVQDLVKKIQ